MTHPQYQPGMLHIDPRYAPQQQPAPVAPLQQLAAYQQQAPLQQPTGGAALPQPVPGLATAGNGGAWPKMRHLQGCTIILEPLRVDETAKGPDGKEMPEAYFHLTVVDAPDGVIRYGDSLDRDPAKQRPLSWERAVPCRFTSVNDRGWGPVNEVRNALASGEPARVGVVEQGTQGNRPYLITKPDKMVGGGDRPDGTERFERASQVWAAVFTKTFTNPEPRSLLAAPAQLPQQVAYGQPAAAPAQPYPTPYPGLRPGYAVPNAPNPAADAYAALAQQQSPYMPQGYATPNNGAGVPEAYAGPGYGQNPLTQAVQQSAPPVDPAFEAWIASLPVEQQAGVRAQYLAQQGPGI